MIKKDDLMHIFSALHFVTSESNWSIWILMILFIVVKGYQALTVTPTHWRLYATSCKDLPPDR